MFHAFWLLSLTFALVVELAQAMPQWDGGWGTQPHLSIGSLVPGATVIEAITEGIGTRQYRPKYLSIPTAKGGSGPAAVFENNSPPVFYIHNGQLWQPTNLTSILRVNVMNVTGVDEAGRTHAVPLKIELSEDARGVDGTWHWRGTKLYFDLGKRSNNGLYFSCQTKSGLRGVYTSLEDMPAPPGCKFMTLHSFMNRPDRP